MTLIMWPLWLPTGLGIVLVGGLLIVFGFEAAWVILVFGFTFLAMALADYLDLGQPSIQARIRRLKKLQREGKI